MFSNVMSTDMLPSPVSVLGTVNCTLGFMERNRSSKLSTSIVRALRSATAGSSSADLPDRSASTPITNGSWIFFSAPYSSTSYSIWTRGARFRALNFWLLCLAKGHLPSGARHRARADGKDGASKCRCDRELINLIHYDWLSRPTMVWTSVSPLGDRS